MREAEKARKREEKARLVGALRWTLYVIFSWFKSHPEV
jgi:hypothetical protein